MLNEDQQRVFDIMVKEGNIFLSGKAGTGKAQPNDTVIPTPNGYKTIGEINVGDYVFDKKGHPTKVLGVYPQGELDLYEVTFADGRKTYCNNEHLWSYITSKGHYKTEPLQFFIDKGLRLKCKRNYRFQIPLCNAVEYPEKKLPIDPYLMGYALGNGCLKEIPFTISTIYMEVVDRISNILGACGYYHCNSNYNYYFYKINNRGVGTESRFLTKDVFKHYPELCCGSYDKFIPEDYMFSSIEQRKMLLQGLMDSDGSISLYSGKIGYSTVSKKLRDDVINLCYSLGYAANYSVDKRNKYKTGEAYEIHISCSPKEKLNMFFVNKKRERAIKYYNESLNKKMTNKSEKISIVDIKECNKKVPMTCIYVDNEEHLYLTNNYIVTHNTTVLNEYISWAKNKGMNVAVCASTGVASTNIKGTTAHRFFKIPIGFIISEPAHNQNLINADVVIFDEIGMCRIDQFEYIAKAVTNANWYRETNGMKPIKLILVGDFFQLRPVITDKESVYMEKYYPNATSGYAFQSKYWEDMNFIPCILTKVVRQSNETTCKALNLLRVGRTNAIDYFNAVSNKEYIQDAIYLCGTNKEANTFNLMKYDKLDTKEFIFRSTIVDQVADNEKPVDDVVKIKVGCRVMIMCNTDQYKNGQMGTVEAIFETDKRVKVKLDQVDEPVMVCMNTWEIYDYESTDSKLEKKVIGSFTQMPLRLAYAITIHKSQGQTYDKVNLNPYCWDCGQLYVALSRVKSVEGLHLVNKILTKYLVTSQEVCDFYSGLVK